MFLLDDCKFAENASKNINSQLCPKIRQKSYTMVLEVHTYFLGFLNHTINFFDQKKVPNNKTNLGKGYLIRKSGNLIWLVLNKQQYGPKMSEKKVQVL